MLYSLQAFSIYSKNIMYYVDVYNYSTVISYGAIMTPSGKTSCGPVVDYTRGVRLPVFITHDSNNNLYACYTRVEIK